MFRAVFGKIKEISIAFFDKPSLYAISQLPNNGEVTLVDVGAAGEIEPRWRPFSQNLSRHPMTQYKPSTRMYQLR